VQLFESISWWYSQIVYVLGCVNDEKLPVCDSLQIGAKFWHVNALPHTLGVFIGK